MILGYKRLCIIPAVNIQLLLTVVSSYFDRRTAIQQFHFIMCINVYTNKKNLNHNCESICWRPSSEFVIAIFTEVEDQKALSAFGYESYIW